MRNVDWKHSIQRSSVRCTSDYDEGTYDQPRCKYVECCYELFVGKEIGGCEKAHWGISYWKTQFRLGLDNTYKV